MKYTFDGPMGPEIERFVQHKRSLGHLYRREEAHLRAIDEQAAARHDRILSEDLVRAYLTAGTAGSRPHRLTIMRQFARFMALDTPSTFVPPARFLGIRRSGRPIRVLSRQECVQFLDACDRLPGSSRWAQRGLIHGAALRTLLLTGLRSGEALRLHDQDVDLEQGVVTVLGSKFGKSRFVPLAPDLVQRLRAYRAEVTTHTGDCEATAAFFPGPDGHRPGGRTGLYRSFRRALDIAGIVHRGIGYGPRCHDLRHAFAVLKLLSWYERGEDLKTRLPLLATYLGHVGMMSSQVYLHMTRDLVGEVTRRHQERFPDLITASRSS